MDDQQFSSAELRLKQVDVPGLSDLGRYVFESAFGTYSMDDSAVEQASSDLSRTLGGAEVEFDRTTPRRFAGDRTLPRARYYSIADDDAGWDDRTLLREISAYLMGSNYPGLVSFFDTAVMNSMELLGILAEIPKQNYKALDLSRPSFLIALRPLTSDAVLKDAYGRGRHYVVQIPFTLTTETFDRVIDLRRPEAQAWLVGQFASRFVIGDEEFPTLLNREPPSGFAELLPSLLDQWLGGGWSTGNLTGLFARQVDADGLVYPSARSNCRLQLVDGIVRDFACWCFVHYRGTPALYIAEAFSVASDDWPTTAGWSPSNASWVDEFIPIRGARVNHVRSGEAAGSWNVEGLAEFNGAQYRLSQAFTILKSVGGEEGAVAASRLAYMGMFSESSDLKALAELVTAGLLGDGRSKATLGELRSAAGSEYERTTLDELLRLVDLTPPRFRLTGVLAKAWGYT